ncbi:MAG TPA: flagellar hook-associated protein FlgL [Terriglobales bacterium]|jgi:flagellar hook-associated protein 3 FlgL
MRVNPHYMTQILESLAQTQQLEETALQQMASGRRINKPSDDAAGAAVLTQIQDKTSKTDSYLRSIGDITGQLQTADSTLGSVVTALQRAITLGVQGATGTESDADRMALAQEASGIRDSLISLANTSFEGRFIFSGTSQNRPYALDNTQASGVRYDGNSGVNHVTIGDGFQLQMNLPGAQLFSATGPGMFQAINDLITSLTTDTGIDAAVTSLRASFDHVTAQRVFYGNALNQIESQQINLSNLKLQLSQQENVVAGADLTQAASQLVNAENARNAALAAVAKVSQSNLFDFLR